MRKKFKTILISGARAPIALEMARSFKKAGHRVIMMDSMHFTVARWSNTIHKYYVIPSPRFENKLFVEKVQEIIQIEQVDHFIPTCEEAIFVAKHRDKFTCKVWTDNQEKIINLHNKLLFCQLGGDVFPIPKTIQLNNFNDWSNSDQYVFKPIYSRFSTSVIIKKKLNSTYFKEKDKVKWIAQKHITGKEICVYSIWEEGEIKGYSAYHPAYRAGKGSGIFFEPITNEKIFSYVKSFGQQIRYTGQLSFDVILDDQQTPYFIECNPRGTSGAHLINQQLAEVFLGKGTYVYSNKQEYAIKYAMAVLEFRSFFKNRVQKSKDIIFDWNDLKPFFFQIFSLIEITIVKLSRKTTWLEATTGDIEWNGDEN